MALSLVQQLDLEKGVHYYVHHNEEIYLTPNEVQETAIINFLQIKIRNKYIRAIDEGGGEEIAEKFRHYFENLTEIPEEFEFLTV